eukprot:8804351-Prorocentrum_lima.AAC.1
MRGPHPSATLSPQRRPTAPQQCPHIRSTALCAWAVAEAHGSMAEALGSAAEEAVNSGRSAAE